MLAHREVLRLDLLLRALDGAGDHAGFDRHALFHPEALHQARDTVGPEDAHQVVLQRQVEAGRTRIALAAGAATQLVVDAARFVTLGADDVQPAEADDFGMLGVGDRREVREDLLVARPRHPVEAVEVRVVDVVVVVDEPLFTLRKALGDLFGQGLLAGHELGVATEQDVRAAARHVSGDGDRADTAGLRDELRFLLRAGDPAYVYFVEFRGKSVFLRASPIDVSEIVRDLLLDRVRGTVLTSATLTVDGAFDYVKGRLGIGQAEEVRLASEFDYESQALLYLPPRMPEPRSPEFAMAAGHQVIELLKRSQGRAFVLFTSYASLRSVQAIVEMALEYPMLVQGTAPRSQLLKQFREIPNSVLFATSSFWQGVDVVGEALSCVIVDKLPFASPSDPVTSARIEAIRARGGEPFNEYQVPLAILTLQQGLGRLIRHRRDRGVLAVLDPRMRTKGYGRRFIASVPPAPVVHDLDAVERFFSIV